jgi:predicted enzyme related to lactoylglutathione lyase
MTDYAPGTPSWVDLAAPDPDAAAAFYGALFGWELAEPRQPEFGGYRNFHDDGRLIAGLNPMGEQPAWTSYVSVADADETVERITAHGGQALFPPMDVAELGRMAICADPEGTVFGLWQPGEMRGADKVNEPVSLCWNELRSRRLGEVAEHYAAVFAWEAQAMEMGAGSYTVFNLGGRGIAGALELTGDVPAEIPSHWLVYFSVVDADATAAKAAELGAQTHHEPSDIPGVGRFAVFTDPQGAAFGILQGESPDE